MSLGLLALRRGPTFVAAVALLFAWTGTTRADDLKIYPVAGLFGPESSGCALDGLAPPVRIAPALCSQFGSGQQAAWGQQFRSMMVARFGASIRDRLDGPLPDGLTREAMVSQTVVASLHLSRADLWTVPKQSVIEVHMPITLSLMLTNVLTGEVLLVQNLSTNVQGLMPQASYEAQAVAEFPERFNQVISTLVEAAAASFRPSAIEGVVRGRTGPRYVLDVGRRGGLREGDPIGADASVVFADADYAIIEPALGSLTVGQALSRQIAQPVEHLERPSMLVVTVDAPQGVAASYLTTLMEDALGGPQGFAVVPVSPSLPQIREPALTAAGVAGRLRRTPDYFLRLSVAALDPIEADTNVAGVRRRVQEARAFVEVINPEGRVVFASQGVDQRVDEIVGDMAPSSEQRRDAALKNAIIRAAAELSEAFKPSRLRLEIDAAGDEVRISDPGGVLTPGTDAVVVRRVGRVSGIEGEVWAPVTDVEVTAIEGAEAVARYAGLEAPRIQRGDQVAYEAAGPSSRSRRIFAQCLADGVPALSVRGSVVQPLLQPIAQNSFAREFSGAVKIASFHQELRRMGLESQFDGIGALGAFAPPSPEICFEPVHQVDLSAEQAQGRQAVDTYDLTIGYVLKKDDQRVSGGGLQQRLSATAAPPNASAEYRDRSLQIDLATAVTELARQAARDLDPPL